MLHPDGQSSLATSCSPPAEARDPGCGSFTLEGNVLCVVVSLAISSIRPASNYSPVVADSTASTTLPDLAFVLPSCRDASFNERGLYAVTGRPRYMTRSSVFDLPPSIPACLIIDSPRIHPHLRSWMIT